MWRAVLLSLIFQIDKLRFVFLSNFWVNDFDMDADV